MPRNVLDTNELIAHFFESKGLNRPLDQFNEDDARSWADALIQFRRTDAIVTPVAVEMLAGARNAHELRLFRVFLARFQRIDDGRVLPSDWEEATRLASRVPHDGKRRQLVDCLIRALAKRLSFEIITRDKRFFH